VTRAWTPDDVLSLMRGFQPACVLAAGAELDVFGAIGGRRVTAPALAAELRADPRALTILLDALASLDLLSKEGGEYAVPLSIAAVLTATGSRSVLAMVRHQANCLRRWAQLAAVTRGGAPADRMPSLLGEEADQASFIGAMHDLAGTTAPALVAELGPLTFRRLLDVGGASGSYTIAFLEAVPGAVATLFDLPAVIPMARQRVAEAGLADRVTFAPGDFYVDPLPTGADFAWISAIVHQNSREQNRELFANVYAALTDRGQVMVRDIVMDESRTQPPAGAMFAVNMLVGTQGGGTFTFAELRDDLSAAGFADVTLVRQDEWMNSIIRAVKG